MIVDLQPTTRRACWDQGLESSRGEGLCHCWLSPSRQVLEAVEQDPARRGRWWPWYLVVLVCDELWRYCQSAESGRGYVTVREPNITLSMNTTPLGYLLWTHAESTGDTLRWKMLYRSYQEQQAAYISLRSLSQDIMGKWSYRHEKCGMSRSESFILPLTDVSTVSSIDFHTILLLLSADVFLAVSSLHLEIRLDKLEDEQREPPSRYRKLVIFLTVASEILERVRNSFFPMLSCIRLFSYDRFVASLSDSGPFRTSVVLLAFRHSSIGLSEICSGRVPDDVRFSVAIGLSAQLPN
ncbi:hypothetical protein KCU62_g294, partial [Aureobasidium sp. EXF-3399]